MHILKKIVYVNNINIFQYSLQLENEINDELKAVDTEEVADEEEEAAEGAVEAAHEEAVEATEEQLEGEPFLQHIAYIAVNFHACLK